MNKKELECLDGKRMDGLLFCREAYSLFNRIRRKPAGRKQLRMRQTVIEKRLIEEILPIARYIQFKYRVGRNICIKWLNGNQNYDAVIRQEGTPVEANDFPKECYLEATCAVHPNDYLSREHINNGNPVFGLDGLTRDKKSKTISSTPVVRSGRDFVRKFADIVINRIDDKSSKAYPDNTILVVECNLDTLYTDDEWAEMINLVKAKIKSHPFIEIFLCDSILEHYATISGLTRRSSGRGKALRRLRQR
ncbi:MAG: hypothetical protein L0Y56_12360 [Nitrospira sp.]|nr:hypothetical protein [Nitrospira sp.]